MVPPRPEVDLRAIPFLRDPDLRDLLSRLARRFFDEEARAQDVVQSTYLVAMELLVDGREVGAGAGRGWMCRVLQNRAFAELKKLQRERRAVDLSDIPDIPAEDQRELAERQAEVEKKIEVMRAVMPNYPGAPELLLGGDARKGEGAAKDPATRKKKQRLRIELRDAIVLALGALFALLYVRTRPPVSVPQPKLVWDDRTLAAAGREMAAKECAAGRWSACLQQLEEVKRTDPPAFGPADRSAQAGAVAGLREDALRACKRREWSECLDGLDEAEKYDSAGAADSLAQLARSKAATHVRHEQGLGQLPDAKGPFEPQAPR